MTNNIIRDQCRVKITLHPTFALMSPSPDPPSPVPLHSLLDSYNYNDNDDDFKEVEYGDLPLPVQNEVIKYLESNDFLPSDNIKEYVLSDIGHTDSFSGANSSTCKLSYPRYNINVTNMDLYVQGKQLFVVMDGILALTPVETVIKQKGITRSSLCSWYDVTFEDVSETLMDGFHKTTHDGPLITEYGNYLGEDDGRYMLYFDYHGITVDINC